MIRSDQGTNLVGARNELKQALQEMNKEDVKDFLLKQNCDFEFRFNVPTSSHMGGVWERQIRSVKSVLCGLMDKLGHQLDDESLRTFMAEVASVVNSRPLSVDNLNGTDSLEPLTPNHLITMKSKVCLPPPGCFQRADQYSRKRWRVVQYLANQFWKRWREDYLNSLQTRQKWTQPRRNLQIDDIVIVKDDNLARNHWVMARVVKTFPDSDGHVRKVQVQVGDNHGRPVRSCTYLERPVHKLILLIESKV